MYQSDSQAKQSDEKKSLGFLAGEIKIPEDFDRMGEVEIAALFDTSP